VRDGTQQQLAEEHAVDAEVFGIFGFSGDLGDEIGGRVVLTDQFVGHGLASAAF
jgi:hypothetical protein